jgi:hypothetical protein
MVRTSRKFDGRQSAAPRRNDTGPRSGGQIPRHRWEPSGEELFGRRPFTFGSEPRYFGTGVAGYESGPGFTGGYYGYGEESPDIPTELEREYAYDVYGEHPVPSWTPARTANPPARYGAAAARAGVSPRAQRVRRYPPGPKGYQRSDERMREEICDELMRTAHLDSSDVTIDVTAAKAVLEGTVPERWMKHAMEDLADACPGIQDVENRIRVDTARRAASGESV